MPRTIRFHLDENCHRAVAEGLRRRGIEVTTTPDVGLMSATDEQQIAFALTEGRVIFTQDRDFLRLHAAVSNTQALPIATRARKTSAR
jgi:predicted nuclease of predicted toxin-antitoxin system